MDKKPYSSPRLIAYQPNNVPDHILTLFGDEPIPRQVTPAYTTVVDHDRIYVDVSESFCDLVGYKRQELIGTKYDHLTAVNTANIPATYKLFSKLGYMQGLWMLAHRTGYRILVRYEAWVRPDKNIQSNIELLQTII